jgi:hypothetical protein
MVFLLLRLQALRSLERFILGIATGALIPRLELQGRIKLVGIAPVRKMFRYLW